MNCFSKNFFLAWGFAIFFLQIDCIYAADNNYSESFGLLYDVENLNGWRYQDKSLFSWAVDSARAFKECFVSDRPLKRRRKNDWGDCYNDTLVDRLNSKVNALEARTTDSFCSMIFQLSSDRVKPIKNIFFVFDSLRQIKQCAQWDLLSAKSACEDFHSISCGKIVEKSVETCHFHMPLNLLREDSFVVGMLSFKQRRFLLSSLDLNPWVHKRMSACNPDPENYEMRSYLDIFSEIFLIIMDLYTHILSAKNNLESIASEFQDLPDVCNIFIIYNTRNPEMVAAMNYCNDELKKFSNQELLVLPKTQHLNDLIDVYGKDALNDLRLIVYKDFIGIEELNFYDNIKE